MANTKQREFKIEWLKNTTISFFKETKNEAISKNKLIAEFCLAFNSTERTAKECLKILHETGFLNIDGDKIKMGENK